MRRVECRLLRISLSFSRFFAWPSSIQPHRYSVLPTPSHCGIGSSNSTLICSSASKRQVVTDLFAIKAGRVVSLRMKAFGWAPVTPFALQSSPDSVMRRIAHSSTSSTYQTVQLLMHLGIYKSIVARGRQNRCRCLVHRSTVIL